MNWLGAFVVVLASYLLGILLAKDEGIALKSAESLLSLLSYMKRRMQSERTPLFAIFSDFNDRFLQEIGFLDILRSHREGISVLWQEAVKHLKTDSETEKECLRFGESLGQLPLDEQIARLDALTVFLTEKCNTLRKNLPDKQKSIKTVCLLLGLMTAIILL